MFIFDALSGYEKEFIWHSLPEYIHIFITNNGGKHKNKYSWDKHKHS